MTIQTLADFVNTRDLDSGEDRLDAWLSSNDPDAGHVSDAEVDRLRGVREAIRHLLMANNGFPLDREVLAVLEEAGARATLRVTFTAEGAASLEPDASGADALIGRLLGMIERAQADGSWERLKACAAEDCHWAFYDQSRNRSRHWCSMSVCGNRAKARSYRSRN